MFFTTKTIFEADPDGRNEVCTQVKYEFESQKTES